MNRALIIFQALGDSTRLRILRLLQKMELSVGELAQVLGQSQPRVSRHIKILAEAGLIERRKEGSWVFLTLGSQEDLALIFMALDRWAMPWENHADSKRLQLVRNLRVGEAEDSLEEYRAEWNIIRALHVEEKEVEEAICRLLGDKPLGRLVDIGTGTGRMLQLLSRQASCAIGFDRSPAMLRLARAKLDDVVTAEDKRIELRQGDFYALPIENESSDLVVMHQVLHYAQYPAVVIAEAARILSSHGRLLIVDFAPHNREEFQNHEHYRRLGLSDYEMEAWFKEAGFKLSKILALEGALTVKLWLGEKNKEAF